ncbi:MAG TPA: c-type cytochrome biogenesis protein CcmI [Xanthobacteraceae bacterium]|nr:c-type cytochrome biogenesis protein CcmI [Xanthobacteraceae bacterium]
MTLWIIFALMTAAAILAVLWPLGRKAAEAGGGNDLVVYRDQLDEIGRDHSAGLIGQAEAEAARVEVSRRLLAAADAQAAIAKPTTTAVQRASRRRAAAIAALLVLPVLPLSFYLMLGSPDLPGQPAFARVKAPQGQQTIEAMVAQVEAHLASNPNDGAGWEVIAPVYLRLGRIEDAVLARRKALALNGETATRDADLGEALVAAANGVVTDEAKTEFERAVGRDAKENKARYFLGLADEQDGNREAAAKRWRAMLQDAPAGAPWIGFVREALGRVTGEPVPPAAGPSDGDVAAATNLSDAQRDEMVRGMVARLADRLHADGGDVEDWLKLVRAYAVLGDRDKAKDAAADARHALASRPDDVKRIDDLAKGLGLEG